MHKSFLDGLLFAKYLFIHTGKIGEGDVATNTNTLQCVEVRTIIRFCAAH